MWIEHSDPALWHRREEAVCLPGTFHFACVWQDISDALAGRHIVHCVPTMTHLVFYGQNNLGTRSARS